MTKLSVNINKIATLRNARGGNNPDVVKAAIDCQRFGAQGVTVHPRPDERHIRYADVREIRPHITTEFNIEGYPSDSFMDLVLEVRPDQVTLVPDPPDAITSSEGWDTIRHKDFLVDVIGKLQGAGIRTSIFIDTDPAMIMGAKEVGTDRVELYTEPYARNFPGDRDGAVAPYVSAARVAMDAGLELNAGHDLDLHNLKYFVTCIPYIQEVSIGHALVCDALYYGLENTIKMYLRALEK
ncbi:MAG: pyridoxine 5'-phosphate synthase [Bacteroidales bacterium]|nr:pyridoxine 5'-phosphate synthase [Bacteroidales bacterium]MDT8432086.1 pyridoxine 5'-phosphate synthase [Bacteroidales bacterium]